MPVNLATLPISLSQAVYQIYHLGRNVKVYHDQCEELCNQCSVLVDTLRENSEKLVGTDFTGAMDETEATLELISSRIRTWASWSKPKSLLFQAEIKQGIDDMRQKLNYCAARFNIRTQMDIRSNQEEARLVLEHKHAETQEKLHLLLGGMKDLHTILKQPVPKIEDHMLHIQEVIRSDIAEPEQGHRLQEHLLNIHRQKPELLPPMVDLTGEVRRIRDEPVNTSGGYSDVYLGEWLGDEKVALKLIRGINQTPKAQKRFIKEVAIWRELQHKNVARLYGVATLGDFIYAVSPWMKHGDANHYMQNNPHVDRLKLLREVATGLEFLHNRKCVHGDLRAANILISDAEVACITDFGLSIVLEEEDPQSSTSDYEGNCRWMAPELIHPELVGVRSMKPNKTTDVWSFGMVCLEVLTGKPPFHERPRTPTVIASLIGGLVPDRPPVEVTERGLSDGLWTLMQQCWNRNPEDRPAMSVATQQMRALQLEAPSQLSLQPDSIISLVDRGFNRHHPSRLQSSSVSTLEAVSTPSSFKSRCEPPSPSSVAVQQRRPFRRQSSSFSTLESSTISFKSPYEPPSPLSVAGSLGDSVSLLPNTPRTPPSVVVPLPEDHVKAMPASVPQVEDSPRFPPLIIGKKRTELDGDVLGSWRPVHRRIPIVNVEQPSAPGSPNRLEDRATTSRRPGYLPNETLAYIEYRKDGVVGTATLSALVDRLLHSSSDSRKDMEFRETFLVSYRAFSNAEDVFELLMMRFEDASSQDHTPERRASVRYSVLKVLISCLEGHRLEPQDLPLLERMRAFTEWIERSSPAPVILTSAANLTSLIDSQVSTLNASPVLPPTPLSVPSSPLTPSHPPDITPQGVAQVLTLLEGERYGRLMASDCIGWLIDAQDGNGISSLIAENDRISYWVRSSILKPKLHSERSDTRKYFLEIAEECRKMHNYSSCSAIFVGLAWYAIKDLKRSGILGKSETKIYTGIEKLVDSRGNYQAYRKALKSSGEPCIPMLSVHLGDIKKFHSVHPAIIQKAGRPDMVDFGVYHDLHDQIRRVLGFQHPPLTPLRGPPPSSLQDLRVFIDGKIRAVVVNDALHQRLHQRADVLKREEEADYLSHRDELRAAGFIRAT